MKKNNLCARTFISALVPTCTYVISTKIINGVAKIAISQTNLFSIHDIDHITI